MSNVFGVDIDELASVFEDKGVGEIPIVSLKPKGPGEVDEEFEKKKRKVEEDLREHINISTKGEHAEPSNDSQLSSVLESTLSKAPRIKIYKLSAPSTCTHEVAYPPGIPFKKLEVISEPKLLTFPFALDPFQSQALLCIDNNQSVMVSAHTSAGKTVIAEYAIAKALRDKQRVIYTTPIKALSNQKYREFSEEFPEVGLLTGDATININAGVLIMTTEILQSMLYRGSSIMREVGWVVFDEIHYMRDPERGVVWEESLVLLPDCVRFVFLSATTPNARQFAEWIAFLHSQPCHVVATDTRPVPLRHYMYPIGGDGLYLVLNEGNYIEENFRKAMASFPKPRELGGPCTSRAKTGPMSKKTEDNVSKMVRLVRKHNLEPVIVFCFSRKECEIYALKMSECDFITPADKNVVEEVFKNAIGGLSPEDRSLPQVESVLPLLKKGIGIHHGGLLPILKETVEILFGEGLMKEAQTYREFHFVDLVLPPAVKDLAEYCGNEVCLFATETFAMGLNMPARTVVFTSVRKYDGVNYRWITAGEYIQMSGRAGRRGKDASGTVILMVDETLTEQAGHAILQGKPAPLNSAFHITYNMLLNLLRVEEINPEYLMERSFCQFQNYSLLPELSEELNRLKTELSATVLEEEKAVESYRKIQLCLQEIIEQQWRYIRRPEHIVSFLQPGRLVKIESGGDDYGWGVVINLKKRQRKDCVSALETFYVLDCLLATRATTNTTNADEASSASAPKLAEILPVRLDCVCGISAVRLMVPQDLRSPEARSLLYASIEKVKTKLGVADLPNLDPVRDMHIMDAKFKEITEKVRLFEQRLEAHPLHKSPRLPELLGAYERREAQQRRIDEVTRSLTQKVSLIQMDDLVGRKRVLRRLGFCNEHDVIELKGRVACEITSADELVLTELLFEGTFNRLSAEQVASLLSCFVFDERGSEMPKLSAEMADALRTLQDIARRVARISRECRLPVDPDTYVDSFKPYLMDLVLSWAHGATFASVCAGTDLFEGTIIRCLRLLEELLRQMINAARTIGNAALEAKFNEAIEKIKRDIVFAASLYL